jgi:hypothetical protein
MAENTGLIVMYAYPAVWIEDRDKNVKIDFPSVWPGDEGRDFEERKQWAYRVHAALFGSVISAAQGQADPTRRSAAQKDLTLLRQPQEEIDKLKSDQKQIADYLEAEDRGEGWGWIAPGFDPPVEGEDETFGSMVVEAFKALHRIADKLEDKTEALLRQPQAQGWQPIESAKRDQRRVFVGYYDREGVWREFVAFWALPYESAPMDQCYWRTDSGGTLLSADVHKDAHGKPLGATHWHPLPSPPAGSQ